MAERLEAHKCQMRMEGLMNLQTKRVVPSKSLQAKISAAYAAKDYLVAQLKESWMPDHARWLLSGCLRYAEESYELFGVEAPNEILSRLGSIINGPLYISLQYPQPTNIDGTLLVPVAQLNLEWFGNVTGKDFPQSLLQLWWDPVGCTGVVREVPLREASIEGAVELTDNAGWREVAGGWLPGEWICSSEGLGIQILECLPAGVCFPEGNIDAAIDNIREECNGADIPDGFIKTAKSVSKFSVTPKSKMLSVGRVFGYIISYQSNISDFEVDGSLLRVNWSIDGGANFLYKRDKDTGKFEFSFYFDR